MRSIHSKEDSFCPNWQKILRVPLVQKNGFSNWYKKRMSHGKPFMTGDRMEISAIHEAALRAHVVPGALDRVTALVRNHFGTAPPKPAELDTFLAGLAVWTK